MKAVNNLTRKPLKVPLDGGRFLHLGPNKSGQVPDRALERPAFIKMVERGEIEVVDDTDSGTAQRGPSVIRGSSKGPQSKKANFQSVNRSGD